MTDVHELLRMKEHQLARVRQEIQALHVVAPLLSEHDEAQGLQTDRETGGANLSSETGTAMENSVQDEASLEAADVSQSIPPKRSRLLNLLGLAAGE